MVRSQRKYLNACWQFMGNLPLLTTKWNLGVNNYIGEIIRMKMTLTLGVLWKRLLKKYASNWKVWIWQIGEWRIRDLLNRQASQQEKFGPLFMKSWTFSRSVQDGSQERCVLFRRTLVANALKRTWSRSLRIRNIFVNVWCQETSLGFITEILNPKRSPRSGSTIIPPPLKFGVEKFAGKFMATFFRDEKGLLLLEFMPQKTTITGQTYANTITALRQAVK